MSLTHFHDDHNADVGEIMQRSFIMGRAKDLTVHGPTGTEQTVNGYTGAYALDRIAARSCNAST